MKIRYIESQDINEVLALIQAKAKFDGCLDTLVAKEAEIKEAFLSDQPKAKAIVAEIDGKVIGVATFYDIYSTFIAKPGIWLDDLFVYQTHRKTGAGIALIRKLCQIAVESGCGRIDWIVATDNDQGKDFYHAIGAQIFETVRHSRLDENAIQKLALA